MTKRNSGIDMLRILSMIGIVSLHVIGLGGGIELIPDGTLANTFVRYIWIISFISVDVFGILTGYLNCNKKTLHWNRILDLLVVVAFWSIVITVIFCVYPGRLLTGWKDYVVSILPAFKGRYWYITSYVFVYFMIPYLNRFIETMDRQWFRKFLLVCFVLLSIIPTFGKTDFFRANTGSSPLWLTICYFIGAYLRKFDVKLNRSKCLASFIGLSTFILGWQLFCLQFFYGRLGNAWTAAYYSPFIIIMAILFFEVFVDGFKLSSDRMVQVLKWMADGMFGVYIIHAHAQLWDKIIQPAITDMMKILAEQNTLICVAQVIGMIVGLVVITLLLDKIREALFRICKIDKLEMTLAGKLDTHFPLT